MTIVPLPIALLLAAAPVAAQQQQQQQPAPLRPPVAAATVSEKPALPGIERPRSATAPQQGIGRGAPVNGVLILYGNERCPTNADGDEIVICERRSPAEQYRVPKELREFVVTPENRSWAERAQGTLDTGVGVNGIGTCSTVGASGATGCFAQASRNNRATNRARAAEAARVP
jgi:hypothetical protein